jgi:hypothetical protein
MSSKYKSKQALGILDLQQTRQRRSAFSREFMTPPRALTSTFPKQIQMIYWSSAYVSEENLMAKIHSINERWSARLAGENSTARGKSAIDETFFRETAS